MGTLRPRETDGITYHRQLGTGTVWKVSRVTRRRFVNDGMRKKCVRLTRQFIPFALSKGCSVVWY